MLRIQGHPIARVHFGNHTAIHRFGADVNRRRHFARCARHAPIGDECHVLTAVLQYTQWWCEFVQFGHAVGFRPLKTHHGDEIFVVQLAFFERILQLGLRFKYDGRCANHAVFGFDR